MADYFDEMGWVPLREGESPPLINIARFLLQMGILDSFDTPQKLPPAATKKSVEDLKKTLLATNSDVECPVCLKELCSGETEVQMPCKHVFHDTCILVWLNKTNSCPVCRYELPTDDELYEMYRKERDREGARAEDLRQLHDSMFG